MRTVECPIKHETVTISLEACTQHIFHIKGSDLEYVSQICNIASLEVEIARWQRKFHIKLFGILASETAVGVVFHTLSA